MIFRFSLYSFLRRQEFFGPFMILAFIQKGLSFAEIGILISVREICINVMEVPSGAAADALGRRKTLVFSLLSYIVSFIVFGFATDIKLLLPAMIFYGIGEAFRSGTHKAMIFAWLDQQDRGDEKKSIYGITRSWGKIGAAVCIIPATAMVFLIRDYSYAFFFSVVPFIVNAANIATYPASLDIKHENGATVANIFRTTFASIRDCLRISALRAVIIECMCYESLFKLAKDYIQPVIKAMALSLPLFLTLANEQRAALLVGAVHFVMHFASAFASRKSGVFVDRMGEKAATRIIWSIETALFALMIFAIYINATWLIVAAFAIIPIKQNLWKPILVCRCSDKCDKKQMATVLSIQSQAKALMLALAAPLIGWGTDQYIGTEQSIERFLPLALFGVIVACIFTIWSFTRKESTHESPHC